MTQKERILKYMSDYGSISPREAYLDLGIMRLAARMAEIIRDGIPITKQMETTQNRYGQNVRYMRYRRTV